MRISFDIDDSLGVVEDGKIFGFKVIYIKPNQENWKESILDSIKSVS